LRRLNHENALEMQITAVVKTKFFNKRKFSAEKEVFRI